MEKFIPHLTSSAPADSFLSDRLIDKVLDQRTAHEIHRITRDTWRSRLRRAVSDGKAEDARLIAQTAKDFGGDIGQQILRTLRVPITLC
jgi:hypothetical protein